MDQPGLSPAEHERALTGLAQLNRLSGSSRILWPPLVALARARQGDVLRVLDVACGGGDVMLALARRARREGCRIEFTGCDISEVAVSVARKAARAAGEPIELCQADVLSTELPTGFDAIICSLFLHHLDNSQAETLLRRMGLAAGRLVLVNDLVRSRRGYWLAFLASRLLTRSAIVQGDGPLSVQRAFTVAEALVLATRAGLAGATVSSRWPMRLLLAWWKA
jgi:2-polyprenyl-3-methyl-5-hydroxy-6-metoxy-1,4-benzoquinol methylase